jgi:heat-inducible transcriptional repressor
METAELLKQQHTSGGRIPTEKAFKLYAEHCLNQGIVHAEQEKMLHDAIHKESAEIAPTLNRAAELLSEMSQCAVFLSTPRFDQDFIQNIRLLNLDSDKLISIIITNFGLIRTETIYLEKPVEATFIRTCEEYFFWRLNKGEKPLFNSQEEMKMAQKIYNEIMVRHVVGYTNFQNEDLIRTGLSKLLTYPEFNDAVALAGSLALLEDESQMRSVLRECCKKNDLSYWIGDEICPYVPHHSECAIIAIPYRINQTIAGGIALLGPMRMPYRNLFGLSRLFSEQLSRLLTMSLHKYKISFRNPEHHTPLVTQKLAEPTFE